MMWGENGQVNGNGQSMYMSDAFFNPLTNQWSKPTAWSVSALIEHHFTPQFYLDLEGSVGQLKWSNQGGGCYIYGFGCGAAQFAQGALSPSATTWLVGADLGWNPVTNLNFDLELMYQSTNQQKPSGFIGTVYNTGGVGGAYPRPGRLARRQRRFRRPLPRHPLLLIVFRSVDLHDQPRSESSGVFVCRGFPRLGRAVELSRRARRLGWASPRPINRWRPADHYAPDPRRIGAIPAKRRPIASAPAETRSGRNVGRKTPQSWRPDRESGARSAAIRRRRQCFERESPGPRSSRSRDARSRIPA